MTLAAVVPKTCASGRIKETSAPVTDLPDLLTDP
jgi:hypothetical protein